MIERSPSIFYRFGFAVVTSWASAVTKRYVGNVCYCAVIFTGCKMRVACVGVRWVRCGERDGQAHAVEHTQPSFPTPNQTQMHARTSARTGLVIGWAAQTAVLLGSTAGQWRVQ
jgi:hypothetical protein